MTFFTNAPEFSRFENIEADVLRLTTEVIERLMEEAPESVDALFKSIMDACDLPALHVDGVFVSFEAWRDYSIKVNLESPLLDLPEFQALKPLIIEALYDDAWMRHLYAQIDQSMIEEAMVQLGQTA